MRRAGHLPRFGAWRALQGAVAPAAFSPELAALALALAVTIFL